MSDRLLFHIGQGDERVTYDFSPGKMLNVEAIAIEKATGLAVGPLLAGLAVKSALSVTGIVWVMRKRQEPWVQFEEVVFNIEDCRIEDPDELDDAEEQADPKAADPEPPEAPEQ